MERRAGQRHDSAGCALRSLRRDLAGVSRESRAQGSSAIKGTAAVYYRDGLAGTEYWLWDDMVERILPGAFDRAIKDNHDARGLFNHDPNNLLGRVSAKTLELSTNSDGLQYWIPFDKNDPDHRRVAAKIDRGDVTGSSFAFIARSVTWEEHKLDDGQWLYVRNITDVDLYDVGPVTWPAYEGTAASRSSQPSPSVSRPPEIEQLIAEREAYLRTGDDEAVAMRLRSLAVADSQ